MEDRTKMKLNVGLLNDSFPPTIDGVANAVLNYATIISENYGSAVVATPKYPHVTDNYPFEVYRYHSVPIIGPIKYRAGNPFSPVTISELRAKKMDLIHVHSPFASSLLAKQLVRGKKNRAPVIFTYHTKYDIDIDKYVITPQLRKAVKRFVVYNIRQANEVWVVSEGAGESLLKLGYKGDYKVMPNGTDFKRGKASADEINEITRIYNVKSDEKVFLFVGRMMWYKNIQIILDSLEILKQSGIKFRAFFVGDGGDRAAMEQYAITKGLKDYTVFTGAIYDRDKVKAFFSLADLFLFPSTYDTSGLVVKEAAACSCPSLLVRGSCASEGVVDNETGLLAEENALDCANKIIAAIREPDCLSKIGENACKYVYTSWKDAVAAGYKRYEEVIHCWPYPLPNLYKK